LKTHYFKAATDRLCVEQDVFFDSVCGRARFLSHPACLHAIFCDLVCDPVQLSLRSAMLQAKPCMLSLRPFARLGFSWRTRDGFAWCRFSLYICSFQRKCITSKQLQIDYLSVEQDVFFDSVCDRAREFRHPACLHAQAKFLWTALI